MNHDPFEEQVRRQPVRPVPGHWRAAILAAADRASCADASEATAASGAASGTKGHLGAEVLISWRERLWPSPLAWSALAAVWLVIFALNLGMPRERASVSSSRSTPASRSKSAFSEQRQILAGLFQEQALPAAVPAPMPARRREAQPRSETRRAVGYA